MYNKVVLMGNLTRDIEIRYSQSGSAIGNTGIAVNRKWKSATGEQKEEVMFVDLTLFGRTAEIANQYLRKGRQVLIDGRLSLDQWTAQDGTKRSKHSVIVENLQMIGGRDDAQQSNSSYGQPSGGSSYNQRDQQQNSQAYQAQGQQYGGQQPAMAQTKPQRHEERAPTHEIPTIDINEDEIPF
ncbi:Single-stranded DNA-binding protein [hydrothermal vent metagenome]|uniref:Single-stranded DNA-binding protein n=1 Tax=hydrothermal vent metagenome TaxID=652676 RepID=A0A1W1C809_9ZZZZ